MKRKILIIIFSFLIIISGIFFYLSNNKRDLNNIIKNEQPNIKQD